MVRIRLRRQGLKRQPSYRVVVTDQRKARNGKYLENIGHYNPRTRPATEIIQEDRALYWLSVGAQPSDAVRRLLEHTGTWERFQRLRAGESMEDLVQEAEENRAELPSPKTNYPAPGDGESKIKAREAARLAAEKSADAAS
ncbi:MAG: 30S ribosomal protein S16 [Chloroflexi bacterium]|nr:30S ribosomal protein S16 [Chloroflexota bacterium]MYE27482.1 30S ribosomal protein S16 [Chloroflexota bacterium]